MAFEIGGVLRPLIVVWIVAWPATGHSDPLLPNQARSAFSGERAAAASALKADADATSVVLARGVRVCKRGLEYRSSFVLRRRELAYRVWGGHKNKQAALGIHVEPRLRHRTLRISAYGTPSGFGVAMRLRY